MKSKFWHKCQIFYHGFNLKYSDPKHLKEQKVIKKRYFLILNDKQSRLYMVFVSVWEDAISYGNKALSGHARKFVPDHLKAQVIQVDVDTYEFRRKDQWALTLLHRPYAHFTLTISW